MHSAGGDTTQLVPGFPIRTPWDHSSVDSSPRPIAASHVLHRLLVPRHPPFALDNLTTENKDARVHCAILNQRPTHNPNSPPPNPATAGGMKNQVMPGIEDQPRAHSPQRLFLQIPNRVQVCASSTSRTSPRSTPLKRGCT